MPKVQARKAKKKTKAAPSRPKRKPGRHNMKFSSEFVAIVEQLGKENRVPQSWFEEEDDPTIPDAKG